MKNKNPDQVASKDVTDLINKFKRGSNRGGYRPPAGNLDDITKMTPRMRLEYAKWQAQELENSQKLGKLVAIDEVEASNAECAEIITNDLRSLGMALADKLAGVKTPGEVKAIIDAQVNEMLTRWQHDATIKA